MLRIFVWWGIRQFLTAAYENIQQDPQKPHHYKTGPDWKQQITKIRWRILSQSFVRWNESAEKKNNLLCVPLNFVVFPPTEFSSLRSFLLFLHELCSSSNFCYMLFSIWACHTKYKSISNIIFVEFV